MKLITWNCQGGFRNKFNAILTQLPDILVVQECEHLDKLLSFTNDNAKDFLWFGHNKNKGVGVFSLGNYQFKLLKEYNPDFKTIVPILVSDKQTDFMLYAICANNPSDKNNQYIEQVWKAINYYDELLQNNIPSILIGDFNSNKIWDRKSRIGNHSDVVSFL
ncbi:MAG: endonuclease/exonuclease/phosphatase family protein [Bacteroidia bacterium]